MSVSTWLPRPFRFIFCERLIRPWRFMPGPARTFPVAVILKRFLTEDFVFSLGILISLWSGPRANAGVAAGHALQARRANERRLIAMGPAGRKYGGAPRQVPPAAKGQGSL